MIQQAFSWQDEGKIKKMVNTKWESVKEGSVLLFSITQESHGNYAITPVIVKPVSEAKLRAPQPNQCKCSKNIQLLLVSQKIYRKHVTISLTFCIKSWQTDQDAVT